MNKITTIKISLVAIYLILVGCSTDKNPAETPSVFISNVNGVEYYNGNASVYKTENDFVLKAGGIYFSFNKQGDFGNFRLGSNSPNIFYSYRPFCSNYFDFNLQSVDEVHKRVKATYSGYIHKDRFELNSEGKFVNGSIDCTYEELVPGFFGLKNEAKINGNQWVRVNKELKRGETPATRSIITETNYSKDEYKIALNLNIIAGFGSGTYNFINSSTFNNVTISKFDTTTLSYIDYQTNGSLIITKKEEKIIAGTYSFTAVNPNNASDILQVTEGSFKLFTGFY